MLEPNSGVFGTFFVEQTKFKSNPENMMVVIVFFWSKSTKKRHGSEWSYSTLLLNNQISKVEQGGFYPIQKVSTSCPWLNTLQLGVQTSEAECDISPNHENI
jgi:hypothetical protein